MELITVRPEDRELLWNLNQKYLYEMTNYYDDELDALGNLHYGYFDAYFTDPKRRAYFLYEGETLVGFAMVHPYSFINGSPDHVMAEFTIFPMYRNRHLAAAAAETIFDLHKGSWEIKYNENNHAANAFWNNVTKEFITQKIRLNDTETVLSFRTE